MSLWSDCSGSKDEATGDHVMESLLFFRDAGEDIADAKRDEAGDQFSEIAARGTSEGNAVALKVGHDEIHHFPSDRALPFGAFEVAAVKPAQNQAAPDQKTNRGSKRGDDGRIRRVVSVETMESCAESSKNEKRKQHSERDDTEKKTVDHVSDEAKPEAPVGTRDGRNPVRRSFSSSNRRSDCADGRARGR